MCSVYLEDSEKVVSISSEHLEPVTPTRMDKVGAPLSPLLYPGSPTPPPPPHAPLGTF